MSQAVQNYLAEATLKASESLVEALLRVPEDKHGWKPAETSRTARDLVTECALLNKYTANLIRTHVFPNDQLDVYTQEQAEVATLDVEALCTRLRENAAQVADAIRNVPDSDLGVEIVMPWQKQSLGEVIAYPHWNMSYHLGQINYIASQLGCLD